MVRARARSRRPAVGRSRRGLVAEGEAHPPVGGAEAAGADPHHLAGGAEGVEVGRRYSSRRAGRMSASRADAGSAAPWSWPSTSTRPSRPRRRDPIAVLPARALPDALPRREEAAEGGFVDRLDLLAQRRRATGGAAGGGRRRRTTPGRDAVGTELAPHDPPGGLEPLEHRAAPASAGEAEGPRPPAR